MTVTNLSLIIKRKEILIESHFCFLFQKFSSKSHQKKYSYRFHDCLTCMLRPYSSYKYTINRSNFSSSNFCYQHTQCLLSNGKMTGRVRERLKRREIYQYDHHLQLLPMFRFYRKSAQQSNTWSPIDEF